MAGVVLSGHKELQRKLARLSAVAQRKVVRPAVNAALVPINKEAKRRCPVGQRGKRGTLGKLRAGGERSKPGALKRSIGRKVKTYSATGTVWGGVGPRKEYADDPGRRVHWVEFGRPAHGVPAQPFLRPALDTKRGEALGILGTRIRQGIEKEARKR
ncbi:MAG TPA: HK97-gp10 family putative phage morphogenesis protein [Vicinamibacterales bacterium]|nr:HK97-gp10 family putative phage morphogenesis protein [Vicinamibacterales bacterium]